MLNNQKIKQLALMGTETYKFIVVGKCSLNKEQDSKQNV